MGESRRVPVVPALALSAVFVVAQVLAGCDLASPARGSGAETPGNRGAAVAAGALPPSPTAAVSSIEIGPSPGAGDAGSAAASATAPAAPMVDATPAPNASPSGPRPSAIPTAGETLLVPVSGFWSRTGRISLAELRGALDGTAGRFSRVLVATGYGRVLADAIGSTGAGLREDSPAHIRLAVRASPSTLGIVPLAQLTPDVRALGVGGASLVGIDRVRSAGSWPLRVPTPPAALGGGATAGFLTVASGAAPGTIWTMVAGGDVMLDRSVYRESILLGRGVDYPWAGGTARVTARYCCSGVGLPLPRVVTTGNGGALRRLFAAADFSMVNLEGPVTPAFRYHPHGIVFSFAPRMLRGLVNAGIDAVSLANNHVRNAGPSGVVDSVREVARAGMVPVGAGANLAAARRPAWVSVAGLRIAILAYDDVVPGLDATASRPGAAPLSVTAAVAAIRAARAAGADMIMVWPHWGIEYRGTPTARQRSIARALLRAGADLIVGNHVHQAAAIEWIDGKPVFYGLGNLVFDQYRSEATLESIVLELTFDGPRLIQVGLRPTVIKGAGQPSFLELAWGGQRVLDQVRAASRGLSGW